MAWNISFESTNIWVSKHMKSYAERTFLTLFWSFAYFRPILAWKLAWNISFKVQTCGCQNIWNNMWKRRFWHYFYVLPTSGLKTSFESKNIRDTGVKTYEIKCGKDVFDTIFKFLPTSARFWPEKCLKYCLNIYFF